MSADWAKLETLVVDGVFTLQRCIGSTDHSGVFLAQSAQQAPADVALKLIPLDPKSAQAQLARWQLAARLAHPHLLRIFQVGVCRLHETHYLYAAMEYADQTLAQVLEGRALTEDEVREMLAPTLGALEFLHRANLAHGGLKPSNILVVGDQLKLASDTVRVIGESGDGGSAEEDVRSLGATLAEALTRIPPAGGDATGQVELPATTSASFRDVVTRCLSQDPRDRPTVASLEGWLRGEPLGMNPPVPVPAPAPSPAPVPAMAPAPKPDATAGRPARTASEVAQPPQHTSRRALPWMLGALAIVAVLWVVSRREPVVEPREPAVGQGKPVVEPREPAVGQGEPVVEMSEPLTPPRAETASPAVVAPPVRLEPTPAPPAVSGGTATVEVMPAVAQSALETVRGTIRVALRVLIDEAGAVVAVTSDDPGPSRYFERRCLDAAGKWKFAPAQTDEPRSMRIVFAITRSGVTASAIPLP